METKRIVILMECGVGTDTAEAWEIPADLSEEDLEDFVWGRAVEHAEMYGIYTVGNEEDYESEEEYQDAQYNAEQISGHWEPYDADKHDGKLLYGTNDEVSWSKY